MRTTLRTFLFFLLVTQICFGQSVKQNQNQLKNFENFYPTKMTDSKFSKINQTPNWVKYYANYDNPVNTSFNSIEFDNENKIIVLGSTEESFPRKNASLRSCYNDNGELQWQVKGENVFFEQVKFDSLGNIYAQGNDSGGHFIMKLNNQWVTQWKVYDFIYYMIVDSQGNIYTTSSNELGSYLESEIVTKKYDYNGVLQWEKKYSRVNKSINFPAKLEFTKNGELVVFGWSYIPNGECPQIIFVKYSTDGNEQTRLNFIETESCWHSKTLAVDDSGSIIIATPVGTDVEVNTYLRKYSSVGILQWTSITSGFPRGHTLDKAGNIYLITDYNGWTTLKYDNNGIKQWSKNLILPNNMSVNVISLDEENNLYVIGTNDNYGTSDNHQYSKIIGVKYDQQGNEKWIFSYPTPVIYTQSNDVKIKSDGEIFIVGGNNNGEGILLKITTNGVLEWEAKYEGAKYPYDIALDMAVDSLQNIYVSGTSGIERSKGVLLKYDHLGNLLWSRSEYIAQTFPTIKMKLLSDGSVYYFYSTNSTEEEDVRLLFIKKIGPNGELKWVYEYKTFVGIWGFDPKGILNDSDGNLYLLSNQAGPSISHSLLFQKFSESGELIWSKEIPDMEINSDKVLSIDQSGNIYLSVNLDGKINFMKYDKNGELVWNKKFNPTPNDWYNSSELILDQNGNAYLMGTYHDSDPEKLLIIKYDNLGDPQWFDICNKISTYAPLGINIENNGDILVACSISDSTYNDALVLVKYDNNGNQQWINKIHLGYQIGDLDFDNNGNIYFSSSGNLIISKYSSSGNLLWESQYVNPTWGFLNESPVKIVTDKQDHVNILVTSEQKTYIIHASVVACFITLIQYDPIPTIVTEQLGNIAQKYEVSQNYPNPFNPSTQINYSIPQLSVVTIKIYDILGNEVTTLVNEEIEAGYHSVDFNANELPSGVYFYQLRAGEFIQTRKMILMK